ncbi:hypothetical protein PUV54_00190 [Hyphococcus flavus]|uniref:Uncharacterized protein n=1 Tax=Hyphococcus flavus TaxID=1866326 RepID=A0AAE9ZEH1_9PROT|nr:hypothetical protein [Hyphococcus flavus]WDI31612.1 hypothetical protein PUV54_00190 [Hyphococcus flavus]
MSSAEDLAEKINAARRARGLGAIDARAGRDGEIVSRASRSAHKRPAITPVKRRSPAPEYRGLKLEILKFLARGAQPAPQISAALNVEKCYTNQCLSQLLKDEKVTFTIERRDVSKSPRSVRMQSVRVWRIA